MTESDAIEILKVLNENYFQPEKILNACEVATDALKEIERYRELGRIEFLADMKRHYVEVLSDLRQYQKLGTVEELKILKREKTCEPRRLGEISPIGCGVGECSCGNTVKSYQKFCAKCGIRLDWGNVTVWQSLAPWTEPYRERKGTNYE